MFGEMQRLAMRRDKNFWPDPADHVAQFIAPRMPRDVNEMGAIGDDLDALLHQAVDHPRYRLLVAGNRPRREDHPVAARQRDVGMLVLRDAGERGARLALAAGAERQHFVRRQIAVTFNAAEILHALEIAGLARHLHHALHRATDNNDFALCGAGGVRNGAQAADMGGKRRHRDATRRGADQFGESLCHIRFRGRPALAHGIGGIADQRQHPGIAERGQPCRIGRATDDRRRIDLPIAGMDHGAGRRADRKRIRFRDRMRNIDEIDLERPEREMPAGRHDIDRNFRRAGLGRAPRLE